MRPVWIWTLIVLTTLTGAGLVGHQVVLGDAPAEVSLEATAGESPASPRAEAGFEGRWEIDTAFGSFDDFTSSFAGYRIDEEIGGIGANTAVGRTPDVGGFLVIEGDAITQAEVTVNMQSLRSDESRRDDTLRDRALETDSFPTATFVLSDPIRIDAEPGPGEELEKQATGEFTLHGVTRTVTIPVSARWTGERITMVSSFTVELADHDIEKPIVGRVLSVDDQGTVELQLHFARA